MFWFLRYLIKKREPAADEIVSEKWESNFSRLKKNRFQIEEDRNYCTKVEGKALVLTLKKKNLFAWSLDTFYRYRDFVLEGEVSFDGQNGYSSAGIIFRYINEENYYYFIISNKGYFRFDLLFNANPISLIGWTHSPVLEGDRHKIRIIAHGSFFSFYVDGEWLAELENEAIDAGSIAFAGQNYDEKDRAVLRLERIYIESRPIEVEAEYYRWKEYIAVNPEQRIKLAHTMYKQGQYTAAVVQLKKASRDKKLSMDEILLLGDSLLSLGLYEEALNNFEKCLEVDRERKEALIGKANALYLLNRFLDLRDFIKGFKDRFGDSSVLWNLYGNAEYSLGNRDIAASAYVKAFENEPEMPLFAVNAAQAFRLLNDREKALYYYLTAARLLFRQEGYEDLQGVLKTIFEIEPDNREAAAILGKMFFYDGRTFEAQKIFNRLIKEKTDDSSIYFLSGLILTAEGRREEALPLLEKACRMEPDAQLYWFRLAENRHLMGMDAWEEVSRALELDGEDPWVLNLAGQVCISRGELERAKDFLTRAMEKDQAVEIVINYSEVLYLMGEEEEAFKILQQQEKDYRIYNQLGNILTRKECYAEAVRCYDRALSLNPQDTTVMENCAAACLELDLLSRAEELLGKVLDLSPTASAYNLIGNVARLRGQYSRAEKAYTEAIKLKPEEIDYRINLADLYLERLNYGEAKRLIKEALSHSPENSRAMAVFKRIRDATQIKLSCASCGREWWVDKNIPAQPVLRLRGEPPPESPAGRCINCGKIYCIKCAEEHLRDSRFVCRDCDEYLKLSDDYLRHLVLSYISEGT
ncbi:MAG: hypothetical protein DRP87_16230 [Spirochaetes bacterium]|nr:MAG: hypothetical protein DRP87_16230 [Spirochaetota bacterium]